MRSFFTDTVPEFTVTQITDVLQRLLHETFYCVKVRGEISGVSRPSSGHVYLTLKDSNSIINAVCWNGTRIKEQFCDGLEVVCTGHISIYQSRYQLIITDMVLAGPGKLAAMLAERKKKLESEGIFDPARKKKLPMLPMKIGVITSPTGAVIRDILSRIEERFPSHVVIWPVQTQGLLASSMVIDAIAGFNNSTDPPDVLIVARGGGSLEELWPFNDEDLARAVAASKIPVVSAIGHETDYTIIDYAADVRASTPTAAVEIVLPEKRKLVERISNQLIRSKNSCERVIKLHENRLLKFKGILAETRSKILHMGQLTTEYRKTIRHLLHVILLKKRQKLEALVQRLNYYDQQNILNVGYTVICDINGNQICSANDLSANDTVIIRWKDGQRRALIITD
ncbi:exodeoxyribonuclease VII large subunit [Candidatus Anaplasma sp. TIGMIC]|uniref:exodeoxyribonuclease VII large subunit n=1 Tax=Candidatus Anaplasma sp. TIGMIC TaxID=3020713 RepID=UPI00232E44EA|nr:exodeoxyribonuclease VII large subunit [Candidatus Anaplasma sp. TIGMIC]MDB1135279.1 exodeoxyribonuclease VII large subunit [Candidatus Anaplasma sp. TIGMIC]